MEWTFDLLEITKNIECKVCDTMKSRSEIKTQKQQECDCYAQIRYIWSHDDNFHITDDVIIFYMF